MVGVAKSLNKNRNYGFIKVDNDKEYFFHRQDYQGDWDNLVADFEYLSKNYDPIILSFTVADSSKGPRACEVSRTDLAKEKDA